MKRTASFNHSFDSESKKLTAASYERNTSITRIEDLSNEYFHEIFDYLDIFDIYKTFFDLNNRFRQLITSSSRPLKIKLSHNSEMTLEHCCKHIIIPNIHRIISLHLSDATLIENFFEKCMINSSFTCLQSITINGISEYKLLILLFYLHFPPKLSSLTIRLDDYFGKDFVNIYRMIVHLPTLQYLNLSFPPDMEIDYSVLIRSNEQVSNLKYLIINHSCSIDQLIFMLYYTPQLCHLTCKNLTELEDAIKNKLSIKLSNLIYINIRECDMNFDDFEKFIKTISSHLEVLRIKVDSNQTYLNANRWKRLIANHIPNLHKFSFKYSENVASHLDNIDFDTSIIQFTSPFWIERGWYFYVEIDDYKITYSAQKSRKRWLELQGYTKIDNHHHHNTDCKLSEDDNLLIPSSSSFQMTIKTQNSARWNQSIIGEIKSIFAAISFSNLHLNCKNLPIRMLMNILRMLPSIDSFQLSSFPLIQLDNLSIEDAEIRSFISNNNKITKIIIEQTMNFDQLQLFFNLCPQMQHLQVSCAYDNNLIQVIRFILTKNKMQNPHFCSLCLYIPRINKKMIHPIQSMIDHENLLPNYIIKYIPDNIILQLK